MGSRESKLKRLIKAVALSLCISTGASALPEGGNVVQGAATITNSGQTQTIRQASDRAIINWNGFNIDVGELVHFVQPNSASAVLNRVIGQDPSTILGAMRANGQVFLINPNGIVFGESAQIDVGSLIVSTLNISDSDFMEGSLRFEQQPDKELAAVINRGTIKIDENGFLVLTGPLVSNEGVILAKVGSVALAGGEASTVSFDPTGLIQIELPTGSSSDDGIVSLTRSAAGDLLSSVVSTSAIQAGQLVERNGQTFLEVESGTVVNSGQVIATGSEGKRGGRIVLDSTANTLLADGGLLSAAGEGLNSDGGEVLLFSDSLSETQAGSLVDVGGGTSGDGGMIEQSSRGGLVNGSFNLAANDGEHGLMVIDPARIIIGTDPMLQGLNYDMVVTEAAVEALGAGSYNFDADYGIDLNLTGDDELTLMSDVSLTFNILLTTPEPGPGGPFPAMTFHDFADVIVASGNGSITVNNPRDEGLSGVNFTTENGDITINNTSAAGSGFNGNLLSTGTGNINVDQSGGGIFGSFTMNSGGDLTVTAPGVGFAGVSDFSATGDMVVSAAGSSMSSATRFVAESTLTVTSGSTNLAIDGSDVLSGTNTAIGITVRRDTGTIDMGGVDTTGGDLVVRAPSIIQSNQLVTNTGDIGFAPASGSIGTALNPVRLDGRVNGGAVGDVFLESVNSLEFGFMGIGFGGTNLSIVGDDVDLNRDVSFSNSITINSISNVDQSGIGEFISPTISITADTITGGLEFNAVDATFIANDIDADARGGPHFLTNLNVVNTNLAGNTLVSDGGEGLLLGDFMDGIGTEGIGVNVFYTTTGDKVLVDVDTFMNTLSITTSGAPSNNITGTGGFLDTLILVADDINIDLGFGVSGVADLTATAGNVTTTGGDSFGPAQYNVSATGDVDITNVLGILATGGNTISGTNVVLDAGFIDADTVATTSIDATTDSGDIDIRNTSASLTVAAAAIGMPCGVDVTNTGNIITDQIIGDVVNIGSSGGSISRNSGDIDANVSLTMTAAGGITAETATPNMSLTAAGPVDITNTILDLVLDVNNPTGTTDITTSGTLTADSGNSVSGTAVTLQASSITADVETADVTAVSTLGPIDLTPDASGPTAISANAASGAANVTISSDGDMLLRDILGNTVTITGGLAGPDITSVSDSVIATTLMVASQGAVDVDTETSSATVSSATSVQIDNVAANANIIATASGPVTVTNTGGLTSTSLTGTSLNVTAADINATGVSAPTITAAATAGDLSLAGTGNVNFPSATATGSLILSGFGDITGFLDAPTVDVASDSLNVGLGPNTAQALVVSSVGGISLAGNSPSLSVAANAPLTEAVIVSNTGSITADDMFGDTIDLNSTGGDINSLVARTLTAATSVTLNGANIDVTTSTPSVMATGTGLVDISSTFSAPVTANIFTTGDINLGTSDAVILNTLTGDNVVVNAGGSVTGTISGTTSVEVNGPDANVMVNDSASFAANISTGDLMVAANSPSMDFDVFVPFGMTTVTNTGAVTGTLRGEPVDVTATDIDLTVFTTTLVANATTGAVNVQGNGDPLDVTATAPGNINVTNIGGRFGFGDLIATDVRSTGGDVTLTNSVGNITSVGPITGSLVTLNGQVVTVDTVATSLDVTSTSGGVFVSNNSPSLTSTVLNSFGPVNFSTTGSASGLNVSGDVVDLMATGSLDGSVTGTTEVNATAGSMSLDVTTPDLFAIATTGDIVVTGSNPTLILEASAVAGNVSVTNDGDIDPNAPITGADVLLDTLGGGDIIAPAIANGTSSVTINAVNAPNLTIDSPIFVMNLSGSADSRVDGVGAMDIDLTSGGDIRFIARDDITVSGVLTTGEILFDDFGGAALTTNPGSFIDATTLRFFGFDSGVDIDTRVEVIRAGADGSVTIDNDSASLDILMAHGSLDEGFPAPITIHNTGDIVVSRIASGSDITVTSDSHIEATRDPSEMEVDDFFSSFFEGNPLGEALTSYDGTVVVNGVSANINVTSGALIATTTGGDLNIDIEPPPSETAASVLASAGTNNLTINAPGTSLSGDLTGSLITITDVDDVDISVTTPELVFSNNFNGGTITGANPSLEFSAMVVGNLTLENAGDIRTNGFSGFNISIDTLGAGDIIRESGTIAAGTSISLDGNAVTANTNTIGLNVMAVNDIVLDNLGAALSPMLTSTTGNVTYTNTGLVATAVVSGAQVDTTAVGGSLSGTFTGATQVNLSGTSVTADLGGTTPDVNATATSGSVQINGNGNPFDVGGSATGSFNVDNTGNIGAKQIDAGVTVDLDAGATGNVTQTSGRLTGNRAQLNGFDVDVDVEVDQMGVTADNDIVVESFLAGLVSPIDLTAGRDINFTSVGDATFTTLSAGRDITLDIGADLSGFGISAPGIVTLTADSISASIIMASEVSATARTGDVTLSGAGSVTVGGSAANGTFLVVADGMITTNAISAVNIDLIALGNPIEQNSGTLVGDSVSLNGSVIGGLGPINTQTGDLTALGSGNVSVTNVGDLINPVIDSTNGSVTLNNTGNVSGLMASGDTDANITATGSLDGSVTAINGTATVSGSRVNIDVTTDTLVANATNGGLDVLANAGGNLDVTGSATNGNVTLDATGRSLTGSLSGDLVTLQNADGGTLGVTTPELVLDTTTGNLVINGTNPSLEVGGTAEGLTVNNDGDIRTNGITATTVVLDTLGGGGIFRESGSITATTIDLTGNTVDAQTSGTGTVSATGTGSVDLNHIGDPTDLNLSSSGGPVTLNNTGNVVSSNLSGTVVNAVATGSFVGTLTGTTSVSAQGTSVDLTVGGATPDVTATSTGSNVQITGNGNPFSVGGSAVSDFNVNNAGDISANQITASGTIGLDAGATGDITQNSGRLTGNQAVLNGFDVDLDLEVNQLDATAVNDLILESFLPTPVFGVDLTAGRDISYTSVGQTSFASISTGRDVTLDLGGDLSLFSIVAPGKISLTADSFSVNLSAPEISATARTGDGIILGTNPGGVLLDGSALNGLFSFSTDGTITTDGITAMDIELTSTAGDIEQNSGSLVGDTVNLTGGVIGGLGAINTQTSDLTANGTGNVALANTGDLTSSTVSSSGGSVTLNNTGNVAGLMASADTDANISASGSVSGSVSSTNGTATVSGTGLNLTVNASNQDLTATTNDIDLNVGRTGATETVTATASNGAIRVNGDSDVSLRGTFTAPSLTFENLGDANINVVGSTLEANTFSGDGIFNGSNANLQVSGDLTNGGAGGEFAVLNSGNIVTGQMASDTQIRLDTLGAGDVNRASGRLVAPTIILNGTNVTAETQFDTLVATSTGDLVISNFVTDPTDADLTAGGSVTFSTAGDINFTNLTSGDALTLNLGQAITGSLTATTVNVTGTIIDLDVTANEVIANATVGDVSLTGTNANIAVTATSNSGNVSVMNTGNVALNTLQGNNISVDVDGNITDAGASSFTGDEVSVTATGGIQVGSFAAGSVAVSGGGDVSAGNVDTTAFDGEGGSAIFESTGGSLTVGNIDTGGATGSGGVVDLSASTTLNVGTIETSSTTANGGVVMLNSGGDLTAGNINTSSTSGVAGSVDVTSTGGAVNLNDVTTTGPTAGNVTIDAGTTVNVNDVDATSTGGSSNITIRATGDVEFATLTADDVVSIDTTGDITDTSNTINAQTASLTGNNINVNTAVNVLNVSGQGLINITNNGTNIDSMNISGADITFNTSGGMNINGSGVSAFSGNVAITAGGNIGFASGAASIPFVSGNVVNLTAGGTITPDLSNALQVSATSGIVISAQGGSIAAAISGSVPGSAITISSGSGPVFYNGTLLNAPPSPPTPPPFVPTGTEAGNVLGQEGNQTVDDGSVGTAANDGIVEESPTQKLVAQLTEGAGGGEEGAPTEFLVTLSVDELGEVSVNLVKASPFDESIESSEDMSAEDVLDLDSGELTEVKVKVLYDPVQDQLVLAIDLSADDIIDLDLDEYQEVPVDVNYSIVGDADLMKENLSADNIIDMDVEDLGTIPIKIIFTGGTGEEDPGFLEIGLQELMTIPVFVEGR